MNGRTTIVLLILVALLGGFIWFFERGADTTGQQIARERFALRIQPDQVTWMRIESSSLKLRFSKQGDGWHMTAPLQTMADDSRIDALLTQLALLPRAQIITEAQLRRGRQTAADFGLDQPRWKIVLGDRDAETTLLIGRDSPAGDTLYLKIAGGRSVVAAATNILSALPVSVADFRNRRLIPGDPDDVARIELRSRSGFAQAARAASGAWQLTRPVATRADATAVSAALRSLFAARVEDFEASSKVGASLYGLDEPALQCSILSRDGTVEQTVLLGKIVEGRTNLVYATKQGEEEIYTVDRGLLASLALSQDDLRDRHLLPVPQQSIAAIRVETGERSLTLERTNGAWIVTAPRPAPADEKKIQLALAEWTGARVRSFNDQPGTNLAAIGLAPPASRIAFLVEGDGPATTKIVYEVSSAENTGATRLVRITGEEPLLTIDSSALAALPPQPLYFRDTRILAIDTGAVRSLIFESAGRTNIVQLDASNAPPAAAAAALKILQPLRARELITADTRDLTLYGLQPPDATLTIGLKSTGSVSRIIMLGKPAPEGGRYATVLGQDLIFTIEERDADAIRKPPPDENAAPGS